MPDDRVSNNNDAIDALHKLHVRSVDTAAGFRKMLEKAEPEFHSVARQFQDLHTSHASQLAALLKNRGEAPDADGSFMSTVNRTVVATRALFDEIDEDVMDQVRTGEEWVTETFDEVIEASGPGLPADEIALIRKMRAELGQLLDKTAGLG